VKRAREGKPLVWLKGEIKTPPFSQAARVEAGYLLRLLQSGTLLGLPQSRPMPSIGARCHELRVNDERGTFRLVYRVDEDAIVILDVFRKQTPRTSPSVVATCRKRLREYDRIGGEGDEP